MNDAAATYERLVEVDGAQAREVAEALVAFKNQVQNGKDILLRGRNPGARQVPGRVQEVRAGVARSREARASIAAGRGSLEDRALQRAAPGDGPRLPRRLPVRGLGLRPAVGDKAMDGLDRDAAVTLREAGAKITEQTGAAIAQARPNQQRAIPGERRGDAGHAAAGRRWRGAVLALGSRASWAASPTTRARPRAQIAAGNLQVALAAAPPTTPRA